MTTKALSVEAPAAPPVGQQHQHRRQHRPRVSVISRSQRLDPAPRSVGSWWPWLTHGTGASGSAAGAVPSVAIPTLGQAVGVQEALQLASSSSRGSIDKLHHTHRGASRPESTEAAGGAGPNQRKADSAPLAQEGVALYLHQLLQQQQAGEGPDSGPSRSLPSVCVRFAVPEYVTAPGQQLIIVGSVPALGSWDIEHGARMTWRKGHRWTAEVRLEPGWHGALEFKVAMVDRNTHIWEPGGNRLLVVERPKPASSNSTTVEEPPPAQHERRRHLCNSQASASISSVAAMQLGDDDVAPSLEGRQDSLEVAAEGPVLEVECLWGKAEAPAPPLPPSLLCSASKPGVLASGQPLNRSGSTPVPLGSEPASSQDSGVVMAHCQVVVPQLDAGLLQLHGAGGRSVPDSGSVPPCPTGAPGAARPGAVQLVLVGSVPALGCWDPAQALRLAVDEAGMWRGSLELPMGYPVQAKLALWDPQAGLVRGWEPGNNRHVRLPDPPASARLGSAVAAPLPALHHAARYSSHNSHSEQDTQCSCAGHEDACPSSALAGAGGVAGAHSLALLGGCWPVMQDGEFLLITHWGITNFPHLVFLPALLDSAPAALPRPAAAALAAHAPQEQRQPMQQSLLQLGGGMLPGMVTCRFMVPHLPTQPHQHLLLVGSTRKLGNWDPTRGLRLQWGPGHSWQGLAALPCEELHETVEAKVVLWDGQAYHWEAGPNRSLRPAELLVTTGLVPRGAWGEVLYLLYPMLRQQQHVGHLPSGADAAAHHAAHTPAVVIPQDMATALAGSGASSPARGSSPLRAAGGSMLARQRQQEQGGGVSGAVSRAGRGRGATEGALRREAAVAGVHEPSLAVLRMMSGLAALALHASGGSISSDLLAGVACGHSRANGSGGPGGAPDGGAGGAKDASSSGCHALNGAGPVVVAAAAQQQHAQVVASLEAAVEQLRTQLSESTSQRHKEVEALRKQLTEASKALASEEDEVEVLHAQLAARGAELRGMQQQLARAEATATAAVAAATTALSSTATAAGAAAAGHAALYGAAQAPTSSADGADKIGTAPSLMDSVAAQNPSHNGTGAHGAPTHGSSSPAASSSTSQKQQQSVSHVAAATFQKLTEQMAVLQLEADTARRALAEAHAAWGAEVAHLRAEVSEAVAQRHKEAECARLASATAALAYQQELAGLQAAHADQHAAHQRELAAAQARAEAVAAAAATETTRLARQLAQACAAAEALESQLMAQRAATASLSASGGSELRRLRALLSSQAHELELLRGQLADWHAAQVLGRLSAQPHTAPGLAAPAGSGPGGGGSAAALQLGCGLQQQGGALVGRPPAVALAGTEEEDEAAALAVAAAPGVPSHLADVMAEVRAAKAALESAARNTPGGGPLPLVKLGLGAPLPPPGTPGPHVHGAATAGAVAAALPGKLNNIVPLVGTPPAPGSNGQHPSAGSGDGGVDEAEHQGNGAGKA